MLSTHIYLSTVKPGTWIYIHITFYEFKYKIVCLYLMYGILKVKGHVVTQILCTKMEVEKAFLIY